MSSSAKLSKTMKAALVALVERGGSGMLTRRCTLLAGGVEIGKTDGDDSTSAFAPSTWLRLVSIDMLVAEGGGRLAVTAAGRAMAETRR